MLTLYRRAIELQNTPAATVCSLGGWGVSVAAAVGAIVGEGVLVLVGANVIVGVAVGAATLPVDCRIRKTRAAPSPRIRMIKPMAAGRLNFSSGNLGPWIGLAVTLAFCLAVNERPHTRQRVAFSLRRVPHVGHTLLVEVVDSGLIISSIL